MKTIYKHIVAAALAMAIVPAAAQSFNSAYFTKDYKFRHAMNAAFGNDQNYIAIPAIGNININLHGNFGYEDFVKDNPLYPTTSDKSLTTFMNPYISIDDALSGFSKGKNRLQMDMNFTILSTGFKAWGGYNTLEVNTKIAFGMKLPYGLFEFAKDIGNNRYEIGDISLGLNSYAEFALGHSRQINEKWRVGTKLKFLFGAARAKVQLADMTADFSSSEKWIINGKASANISLKGLTLESEIKEYNNESRGTYEQVSDFDIDGAGLGGFGVAFDFGAVYQINEDWAVSLGLANLGFIKWENNIVAESSGEAFEFKGFHDVSVSEDAGDDFDAQIDDYGDQLMDFAHLQDKGDGGKHKSGQPVTLNIGGEYALPVYNKLSFGILGNFHMNDDYSWNEGRISINWAPVKWLDGGINAAVNTFGTSLGWVLNIHPKALNLYVGMDHIPTELSKEFVPLNSNVGLNFGISVAW